MLTMGVYLNKNKNPVNADVIYMNGEREGSTAEVAMQWNDGYNELIQDYEFTTFANYGTRDTYGGEYAGKFMGFEGMLDEYNGRTLSEKVEDFLLKSGVTQDEINSIKTIMKG